jgi:hypothetical protein
MTASLLSPNVWMGLVSPSNLPQPESTHAVRCVSRARWSPSSSQVQRPFRRVDLSESHRSEFLRELDATGLRR